MTVGQAWQTQRKTELLAEEGRHGFELLQKPHSVEELSRTLHRILGRVYTATLKGRARPGGDCQIHPSPLAPTAVQVRFR